jgi:hypothetical protein
MNITDIEFIRRIKPNCSCGTGYSEPDVFEITFDNGFKTECLIDCWYRPDDKQVFVEAIERLSLQIMISIDNIEEAYQMYKDEKMLNGV